MSRIISKKLNRFVKKNRSKLLLSLTVISIFLFFLGICLLQRVKPNGDILLQNTGSKSLYMNVNPSFNVSFGNRENPEQQWVRFESVNSTKNPFGEKKRSLWNKIVNAIKPRKNLGVEMSLRTVELNGVEKLAETDSLERVKSVAEVLGTSEIKTSTRLIDMGRVIGDDSKENVSKKTIVNTDVIDGVDLEYQIIEGVGLKEEIVIRNLDGYSEECKSDVSKCKLPPNEFVFDMRLDDGLNLKKGWFTVGQKSYETYYFEDNDGNYVSHFLPSFAVDGIGNKTFDVLLDVVESGDGNYKVRVTVDIEWLFDNKRVFPVRIDPSIVHNSKANFDTGTYISSEYVQSVAGVELVGVEKPIIDENTVGYWKLDENVNDSSSNANHGTTTLYGMNYGIQSSNLTFYLNRYNGAANNGEIDIECPGGDINCHIINRDGVRLDTPTINYGIAVTDSQTGNGYIMYSPSLSGQGITGLEGNNGDHFVAVRYSGGSWQYNNNSTWVNFTPTANNIIVAEVTFFTALNVLDIWPLSTDGRIGKAYEFDGENDYIRLEDSTKVDVVNDISIEFWIKHNPSTSPQNIVHKDHQYSIQILSNSTITWADSSDWSYDNFGHHNIGLEIGKWQHIAVTKSNGVVKIYLNSVEKVSKSFGGALTSTSNIMHIGCYSEPSTCIGEYLNSTLDEIRISNVARSADEIYKLYMYEGKRKHSGEYISGVLDSEMSISKVDISSTVSGVSTGDGETPYSTTGLVAQWNFNETSGTVASSGGSCGSTCNGTLTNFSDTGGQDKVIGSGWTYDNRRWGEGALMFNGTGNRVVVNHNSNLNLTVGAIELWFKLLAPPKSGYNHILDKDSSYGISIYNGQLCAFLNPIGWNCATENLEINKWYHTVLTYDGTVENIFLNNKKIFEKSITSTIGASGYNLAIGARQDGTIAFNGIIDTVRIYNRALTSSEVLSNYNSNAVKYAIRGGNSNNPNDGTWSEWKDNTTKSTLRSFDNTSLYESEEDGLVGYWSMDEESGTTVNDVSGTGNNGTATGTSIVDGRYGKGRSFNGSSDYVTLPSGFNDFTTGMTINLWAKPTVEEASYSTTGLVGQWNFNETSGTVASSGGSCSTECYGTLTDFADTTGQDKVIGSGWTYDNRKNGQGALMFDGSDDVVGLADSDKANITGDISIEFWVNLNNSQNHTVVHKGQQYSILIKSNNTISWADSSYWSYDDFGYHNIGLEIDKWQHIAVTKSNGIVKIYLNGVEKVSKSFGSALTSNTGIMYFGCYRELTTNVCRNGTYLNGTLDTVRIYNRALTAQEVLSNYTAEETLSTINTRFVNLAESEEQDNSNIVFDRWGETDTLRLEVGNGTELKQIVALNGIINNEWHLYTATIDTSGAGKIYRDGILLTEGSLHLPANVTRTSNYIGRSNKSSDALYKGEMDEVKIYNKVFTQDRVILDYLEGIDKRNALTYNSSNIVSDINGAEELPYRSNRIRTTVNDGLISYWKFDESSGNTVADSVGTNDGTATGTTITPNGRINSARVFNGTSSDYVQIPQIDLSSLTSMSASIWVKTTTTSKAMLFQSQGLLLFINRFTSTGKVFMDFDNGSGNNSAVDESKTSVNDGNWHLITGTNDGTTTRLYVDGVLENEFSSTFALGENKDTYFGTNAGNFDYLNGQLDEAKMYNRVLTPQEVLEEYSLLKTTFEKKNTGLVAYWDMDEVSGTSVGDYINNTAGTATGTTIIDGRIEKGRNFNGISDYIQAPNVLSENITISMWIYPTSWTHQQHISLFACRTTVNNGIILFVLNKTSLTLDFGGSSNRWNTGYLPPLNTWTNITVVRNSSGRYLYVNGLLQTSTTNAGSYVSTTANTRLGADTMSNRYYYQGYLDEVKVYNRALTASEVSTEYGQGIDRNFSPKLIHLNHTLPTTNLSSKISLPVYIASDTVGEHISTTVGKSAYANYQPDANTVGLWYLDEIDGNGPFIKDSSGYGNDGIPVGSIYVPDGSIGGARSFNAVNDEYISIKDSTSLNPTAITLEAWIKPSNFDRSANFISKGNNTGYRFRVETSGTIRLLDRGATNMLTSPNTIPLNQWTHAVATGDSTGLKIYINGVLVASNTTAYGSPVTTDPLRIGGRYGSSNTESFTGLIDEVRISNIARTPDEIRQAYEVGLRTHNIEIEFGAMLDNSNLISDSTDTSFTVDGTTKGMRDKGSNIYTGEKIIVREQNSTGEYIAQGIVTSVNKDTGAITVKEWESISTFPTGGFTTKANVFKWQKEYLPIKGRTLDTHLDQANLLTMRIENGYGGRNIWIDNLTTEEYTPTVSTETINLGDSYRFFQYKAVLTSTDTNTSPIIQQVQLDYTSDGPTMEQIMRHGKRFNNGTKQPFWWAK